MKKIFAADAHSVGSPHRRRRVWFYVGGGVALAIGLVLLWGYGTCKFVPNTFGDRYGCYLDRVNLILRFEGATPALEYVRTVVYPGNGYAMVHVLLHTVGEYAYYESGGDIMNMYYYLLPYLQLMNNANFYDGFDGFDGFVHGFMTEYLTGQTDPIPVTMQKLCMGKTKVPGIPIGMFDCYHMLGHGIMHATANDLPTALEYCDTAGNKTAIEGCYYGSFMEDSFLYDPDYHEESPRPDSVGTSMKDVCAQFTGQRAISCDTFVGESYFVGHPRDIAGAFNECQSLAANQDVCIGRLAGVLVASLSRNFGDAQALCEQYASAAYRDTCISSASATIEAGFGIPTQSLLMPASDFLESLRFSFIIAARKIGAFWGHLFPSIVRNR